MKPSHGHARGSRSVLLTGATGFVGGAAYQALSDAGWRVRCLTRDVARASARWPTREWLAGDVTDRDAMTLALEGCDAALYLVHGMGDRRGHFRDRELEQAHQFARAAEAAGVRRIVYLGGVAPARHSSEHLRSRLEVGEALRAGAVSTIELRASMIIGHGSLSWLIVRDLAARLPFMVLPRWMSSRMEPVAIDDVVVALTSALDLEVDANTWFDIPGPDVLSGREILDHTALILGLGRPHMIPVPFLTPRFCSLWVRLVTRADWSVAKEVVIGLTEDLLARDANFWSLIDHKKRLGFDEAARRAIAAERRGRPVGGGWGVVERTLAHSDALRVS